MFLSCVSVVDVKPLTDAPFWQGGCVLADVDASGRSKKHKVIYFSFSS